jgi:hypothetical protein
MHIRERHTRLMSESIVIEANESGRLWAEDPDRWQRLCAVEGCPVCDGGPPQSEIAR